jgi:hypothetical protein
MLQGGCNVQTGHMHNTGGSGCWAEDVERHGTNMQYTVKMQHRSVLTDVQLNHLLAERRSVVAAAAPAAGVGSVSMHGAGWCADCPPPAILASAAAAPAMLEQSLDESALSATHDGSCVLVQLMALAVTA